MTKWARVGVGVWNDRPYDGTAIFSGSCVNNVAGRMTLIYPGVCDANSSATLHSSRRKKRLATEARLGW